MMVTTPDKKESKLLIIFQRELCEFPASTFHTWFGFVVYYSVSQYWAYVVFHEYTFCILFH